MLYNTLTRKKEEFKPISKDIVKLYTCGPTVYQFAHIGNLRTYIFEDILKRTLLYNRYNVKHVMNVTDVGHLTNDSDAGDDKLDIEAKKTGRDVWQLAEFYTEAFFNDINKLNILKPDIICKATDHITEQIELVDTLLKKGYAYETKEAIYFDTSKFEDYGKMAGLKQGKTKSRTKHHEGKRNKADFALWFFLTGKHAKHIMRWNSPWGDGFPGWHIECSAMSMKYLGTPFDIHTGGIDHIPVHHTNEIAQSEAATGKKFVNYWLHGEFLVLDKAKMAKSTGNFITLNTLIEKGFDPLDYRYYCLNAHYRGQLNFSWESLGNANKAFDQLKERIIEIKKKKESKKSIISRDYKIEFLAVINDDLNMPMALAILWETVKDNGLNNKDKYKLILDFDKVLGLNLDKIREEKVELSKEIEDLIRHREVARKKKDWKKADEIREKLMSMNIKLEDTSKGVKWKRIK